MLIKGAGGSKKGLLFILLCVRLILETRAVGVLVGTSTVPLHSTHPHILA